MPPSISLKCIRVTFRIPVDVYKQFKAVCKRNHSTMSGIIREMMIAVIADEKRFSASYGVLFEEEIPTEIQSPEVSENI